jgi:hypothetical protein
VGTWAGRAVMGLEEGLPGVAVGFSLGDRL